MSKLEIKKLKQLSGLFTAKTIRAIADSKSPSFADYSELLTSLSNKTLHLDTVEDLYEESYNLLAKKFKSEYIYKNQLLRKKLLGTHSLKTASMLTELQVESSIADCVILNGVATCYEIKTDLDTFDRLPTQISNYRGYFDKVYVVTSQNHIKKHVDKIPKDIGIIVLTGRNQFSEIRQAETNICGYSPIMAAKILRVSELKNIVNLLGTDTVNIPNTEIVDFCIDALSNVPPQEIKSLALSQLKERGIGENKIVDLFPHSLKLASTSVRLTKNQQRNFLLNVKHSINSKDDDVFSNFERQTI